MALKKPIRRKKFQQSIQEFEESKVSNLKSKVTRRLLHKSCLQDSGCGKTCKRRSAWSCDVNYIKKLCVFPQTIKYICSQFIQYLSLTFRKVVFMEIHHSFVNSVKYPDFQTSLKKNQIKDSALCTTCRKTSQLDLNNSRYNYWTV